MSEGEEIGDAVKANYSSQKEDMIYLLNLVDKYVKVELIKDITFDGYIYSIDPLTYSIMLYTPKGDSYQATLIPGHAVLNVVEIEAQGSPPLRKTLEESQEVLQSRKKKVIAWFKLNLLPVTEVEEIIVVANVGVFPPYKDTDIYAENPVIVSQIRKIMALMPENFEG